MTDDGYRDGMYASDDRLSRLTDATRSPGATRGVFVEVPILAAVPAFPVVGPSLRLDDGTWVIRACRVGGIQVGGLPIDPDELASGPAPANPTFPFQIGLRVAIGGVQWTETVPLRARGTVIVRQADTMIVAVSITAASPAAERILLSAQKHIANPIPHYVEHTSVVPAAGTGTYNVPQGAVRVTVSGMPTAGAFNVTWFDAAAAGKLAGTLTASQFATQSAALVPNTASQVAIGPIAAGATLTVVWECLW